MAEGGERNPEKEASVISVVSQNLKNETEKSVSLSVSSVETSQTSNETGETASGIFKKSLILTRKSSARNVRFSKETVENKSIDVKTRFRESSVQLGLSSSRFSRLFESLSINRARRSTFARPILKYKPTYQLESRKPFNTLVVQDLVQKIVDNRMEAEGKYGFDDEPSISFVRSLSNEILQEVKAKDYDRYKIFVTVTLGKKFHQSLHMSAMFMWNPETDKMAKYVYDRANIFVIVTVFGVYFD